MIDATDLKNGTNFLFDSKPYQVIKYSHIKMGRGGATVRVSVRNLESGSVEEKTFSSDTKVDEVNTGKRKLQFLYKDTGKAVFMDPKTFEQVEIPLTILGEQTVFLKDGDSIDILFWDPSTRASTKLSRTSSGQDSEPKALSAEFPPKVILGVTQTDPGVKGNSAVNIYKSAVLENGFKVKVPLFINVGDKVKVDTRTGEYVERAK